MYTDVAVFPPTQFKPLANIESPEQKKQKKLLLIFAAVVLITTTVIYFGFLSGEPNAPGTEESAVVSFEGVISQQDVPSLEGVSFDFSVFNDPRFTALSDFSSGIDITSVEKGRRNPFK